jgi:hypothetical protein
MTNLVPPQDQMEMFNVDTRVEIDGVEMGVLENGMPFLTESGLARMCGVDRKALNNLSTNWQVERSKKRGVQIEKMLDEAKHFTNSLFLKSKLNGAEIRAYPEPVCMALLEYYAFIASPAREQAISAFRSLARTSFRSFIYGATGYSPEKKLLDSWRHFHDRMDLTLDAAPVGFFGVFNEISGMIVTLIRSGVIINDKVIPDISVGITWSNHWAKNNLEAEYGERIKYQHNYPDYYPQSQSNPQAPWAYPEESLGEFRKWFRKEYIATKFPAYILGQIGKKKITTESATKILNALPSIEKKTEELSSHNKSLKTALNYNPKD